jgi:hypothetical protein
VPPCCGVGRTESTGALPPTVRAPVGWALYGAVARPLTLDPVDGNEKFADAAGSKAGAICGSVHRKKNRFRLFGGLVRFNIGTIKTNMLFLKEPRTDRGTSIVFLSTRESGKHEGYAADLQVPWAAGARQGACCAALIDPLLVALEKR